jgi:hypothetical protein
MNTTTIRDRVENIIRESSQQMIDAKYISHELKITTKEAASILREYMVTP